MFSRYIVTVVVIFLSFWKSTVSLSSLVEREAYESCLEGKQREASYAITEEDRRNCHLSASGARGQDVGDMEDDVVPPKMSAPSRKSRDADTLVLEYFISLGMWKNGQADLESALLDKVAPCWKQHRSLKKKWSSMYHNRRDHEIVLLNALDQRWREDDGMATFPSLDSSLEQFEANGVRLENLDAGELLLQRRTSAEIGENFGRYTTMVYLTQENRTLERIHADRQSSCGSNHLDTMVLDLDTELLHNEWHSAPSNPVQVLIRVNTRRQYFSEGPRSSIPVVQQAIGLVLHFSHVDEGVSPDVRKAFDQETLAQGDGMDVFRNPLTAALTSSRQRRSAGRSRARLPQYVNTRPPPISNTRRKQLCRRISHRLDRMFYDNMNIRHPEYDHYLFDIGRCSGDCPPPLTSARLNATDHAVAVSVGTRNTADDGVCCTPKTYDSLFYTAFNGNSFKQGKLKDFIAKSCACR